jgi:hypothetical protein
MAQIIILLALIATATAFGTLSDSLKSKVIKLIK